MLREAWFSKEHAYCSADGSLRFEDHFCCSVLLCRCSLWAGSCRAWKGTSSYKRNLHLGNCPQDNPPSSGKQPSQGSIKSAEIPRTFFLTHSPLRIVKHWQYACHLGLNASHGEELHLPTCHVTGAKQIFFRQIFNSEKEFKLKKVANANQIHWITSEI